VRQAWGT